MNSNANHGTLTNMTTTLNEASVTTLGRKIRTARLIAGLKQSEVAAAAGVSRSAISQWESGDTEPAATKLFAIAKVTGQSLEWFADYGSEG